MERIPIKIWGAWIFLMHGVKPNKDDKVLPKEGWELIQVVNGKFNDISELSLHHQNYAELDDYCVLVMHGDNTATAHYK